MAARILLMYTGTDDKPPITESNSEIAAKKKTEEKSLQLAAEARAKQNIIVGIDPDDPNAKQLTLQDQFEIQKRLIQKRDSAILELQTVSKAELEKQNKNVIEMDASETETETKNRNQHSLANIKIHRRTNK